MKKIVLAGLTTLILGGYIFAQQAVDIMIETETPVCSYYNTIQGPTDIQIQTEKTFEATVEGSGGVLISSDGRSDSSVFRIMYEGAQLISFDNVSQFTYNFAEPGIYTITHETSYKGCDISTSTNITTYTHTIASIGSTTISDDIINNLKQRAILLHNIPATIDAITEKADTIRDSSLILLDTTNTTTPTQKLLTTIHDSILSSSSPTHVTIISDASPILTKKIIGSIVSDSIHPTYIINSDILQELILLWRIGDRDAASQSISSSLQANDHETSFGFNGFIDSLLFQGIPLSILASMITLVALTVFLIFTRQVVGLNVFSIYYPLLGAITLPLIGKKLFIIFFVIAGISHRITYLLSRKLDILVHAKIGIYLTIYSILSITTLWMISMTSRNINRSYTQNIGTRATLAGFFSLAIIGQKVFQTKKNIRKHITDILTYLIVTIPLSLALTSTTIQYRMITHTWIVFLAIVIALVLGRFTGMKLLEYKRFGKLLWNQTNKFK